MNSLDGSAVQEVANLAKKGQDAKLRLFSHEDTAYILNPDTGAFEVIGKHDREPDTIQLHSLAGLVDLLRTRRREFESVEGTEEGTEPVAGLAVHIVSPTQIVVYGATRARTRRRFTYAQVTARPRSEFPFGRWLSQEDAIIALQSSFVDTENRAQLLKVIGNIAANVEVRAKDDGVSQEMTVRLNLALDGRETLPNQILLAPYRTFSEVEQPESPFVVRAKVIEKAKDEKVAQVALFEADGGAWQEEAVLSIYHRLRSELPDGISILR